MIPNSGNIKTCALCGQSVDTERFCITEQWTSEEVVSHGVGQMYVERADYDGDSTYTFYFCRWRHLGDFMSSCGMESKTRSVRDFPA
ncbi:MAG: hypothetical protein M3Q29_13465 [Chloroflexota bacterium]|nr:hypothetical protein [Chloroflexota bacterium]